MRGGEVGNDTRSPPSNGSPHLYPFLRDQIDSGIERGTEKMSYEWKVRVVGVYSERRDRGRDAYRFPSKDVGMKD
jgi:hypothetical protein